MAVTRSWEVRVVTEPEEVRKAIRAGHNRDLPWLIGASLLVITGLLLTFFGKTQNFADMQQRLDRGELLNLNTVHDAAQLEPFLDRKSAV